MAHSPGPVCHFLFVLRVPVLGGFTWKPAKRLAGMAPRHLPFQGLPESSSSGRARVASCLASVARGRHNPCFLPPPRAKRVEQHKQHKHTHTHTHGCGSKPMESHFVVGAPPILEPILVGIGIYSGYGILTPGHEQGKQTKEDSELRLGLSHLKALQIARAWARPRSEA